MPSDDMLQTLKCDIRRYKVACKSAWPKPSDYTKLIDAQYALRALKARAH